MKFGALKLAFADQEDIYKIFVGLGEPYGNAEEGTDYINLYKVSQDRLFRSYPATPQNKLVHSELL